MNGLAHDLRLAFRTLRRRPAFTAAAVLTLALGLGVNVVAFSAVNALLFKGHAGTDVPGAGWLFAGSGSAGQLTLDEVRTLADAAGDRAVVTAEGRRALPSRRAGVPATAWALVTVGPYFEQLRSHALLGRLPGPDDAGGPPIVVVSERFWTRVLARAPLRGLTLPLGPADAVVVGVLADGFRGPGGLYAPDVWLPIESWRALGFDADGDTPWLTAFGTLSAGATPAEVDARLAAAVATWPAASADAPPRRVRFVPMADGHPEAQALRLAAAGGLAIVSLVLLLACFNVTGLLLARASDRQREFALRAALGASRGRMVRQQAVEGALLGGLAGALALVVAGWSEALLGQFAIPIAMPQRLDVSPDLGVALYVVGVGLLSGVAPGLVPAFQSVRVDLVRALATGDAGAVQGRPSRLRHGLVVLQMAGSTAFLVVAALFVASHAWSASAGTGFDDARLIVAEVDLEMAGAEPPRLVLDRLVAAVRAVPGVTMATAASRVPFYIGMPRLVGVSTRGRPCDPGRCRAVDSYLVAPDHFETLGMRVVDGDVTDRTVWGDGVVVNEAFARAHWNGDRAVGELVGLDHAGPPRRVIAVVADVIQRTPAEPPTPVLYLPLDEATGLSSAAIVARTADASGALVQAVRAAVADAGPALGIPTVETMADRMRVPLWPTRTASGLFMACGAVAALLALAGLAGAVLFSVSRRTREFGVRLALGATPGDLARQVVGGTLGLAVPGVALGLAAAWGLAAAGRAAFVGVEVGHPGTYVLVAAMHVALAAGASLLPARRAARTDPIAALRAD